MSVFQPDTESGKRTTTNDVPTFQVVRKGYDREQVDAYVPKLLARLERAEQARADLQREVVSLQEKVPPTFEELGDDAATVLAEAGRSAELLVEKAKRRAESIVEKAQQEAEQIQAEVTSKAQVSMADAREAAEQIRQEAQQERDALGGEAEQVREFRDGMLHDLGRVHGDIGALLGRIQPHHDPQPLMALPGNEAAPPPEPVEDRP
ncbi:MAG TPA: DivIVA domain-containing protein [Actinomycetes bacterium]|nr:DivIVA domain-containing protein [Actinomycetes bacterium]